MDEIKVPFIRAQQLASISNKSCVVGSLLANDLIIRAKIPYWNSATKTGYQRAANQSRVNDLKVSLSSKRVDIPTAILVNIRDISQNNIENTSALSGFIHLTNESIYIVDGQHRYLAVKELYNDNKNEWGSYLLPCVFILGASELEEMKEFYIVNTTAKSVKTDLAFAILRQRAENENITEELIETDQQWKVVGSQVLDIVEKTRVWKGKVAKPGESVSRKKSEGPIISSSGFVTSIKNYLEHPYIKVLDNEKKSKILISFWTGIAEILPDTFLDPSSYAIQKTVGVSALHAILPSVIEVIRTTGEDVFLYKSYSNIMSRVFDKISGENSKSEIVSSSKFWLSGEYGAIGAYSSSAGQKVLIAKLTDQIREIMNETFK
jgi:DGQHR domain-containing protein